jgi:hypothetical protein
MFVNGPSCVVSCPKQMKDPKGNWQYLFADISTQSCVFNCPTSTPYGDTFTGFCVADCTKVQAPSYVIDTYRQLCAPDCLNGYYPSSPTGTTQQSFSCSPCPVGCTSFIGGNLNNCTACAVGSVYVPGPFGGSCQSKCPIVGFLNFSSFMNNLYSFSTNQFVANQQQQQQQQLLKTQAATRGISATFGGFLSSNPTQIPQPTINVPTFNFDLFQNLSQQQPATAPVSGSTSTSGPASGPGQNTTNATTFASFANNQFIWKSVDFYWNLFGLNLSLAPAAPNSAANRVQNSFTSGSLLGGVSGGTIKPSWSANQFKSYVPLNDQRDPLNIRQFQYNLLSNIYTTLYAGNGQLSNTCLPCFYNCTACSPGFFLVASNGTCVLECPVGSSVNILAPNGSSVGTSGDYSVFSLSQYIVNQNLTSSWTTYNFTCIQTSKLSLVQTTPSISTSLGQKVVISDKIDFAAGNYDSFNWTINSTNAANKVPTYFKSFLPSPSSSRPRSHT